MGESLTETVYFIKLRLKINVFSRVALGLKTQSKISSPTHTNHISTYFLCLVSSQKVKRMSQKNYLIP